MESGEASLNNRWVFLCFAALFVLVAGYHFTQSINHDVAWLLIGVERMLDGGQFGRDVVDVNPPLAWWVLHGVTGLAAGLSVSIPFALNLLIPICIFISLASVAALGSVSRLGLGVLAFLLVAMAGYDYGQREHFLIIFALPYALLAAQRVAGAEVGKPLAAWIGLLAVLGFCIKPHFLIIPCVLEVWVLWQSRSLKLSFRTENFVLAGGAIFYLLAIVIFAPAYLFDLLPQIISNYSAYSNPIVAVIGSSVLPLLVLGVAFFVLKRLLGSPVPKSVQVMLCAGLGSYLVFVSQSKGWDYHLLPTLFFVGSGIVLLGLHAWNAAARSIWVPAVLALVFAVALQNGFEQISASLKQKGNEIGVQKLATVIDEAGGAGSTIMAFNTSPRWIHSAILQTRTVWKGEACCLHFLPAAVRQGASAEKQAVARVQIDRVMMRLEEIKPDIFIIDTSKRKLAFGGADFDYVAWFSQTYPQRFPAWFSEYDQVGKVGPLAIYKR